MTKPKINIESGGSRWGPGKVHSHMNHGETWCGKHIGNGTMTSKPVNCKACLRKVQG